MALDIENCEQVHQKKYAEQIATKKNRLFCQLIAQNV